MGWLSPLLPHITNYYAPGMVAGVSGWVLPYLSCYMVKRHTAVANGPKLGETRGEAGTDGKGCDARACMAIRGCSAELAAQELAATHLATEQSFTTETNVFTG